MDYESNDGMKKRGILGKIFKITGPIVLIGAIGAGALIFSPLLFGVNDANETTVVQAPWGSLYVHSEPGWYMQWGGKVTEYPKQMVMDADNDPAASGAIIDQSGIKVRYRDGGEGTVYGKVRFQLPEVEGDMVRIHKAFSNAKNLAYSLLKSVTEEAVNQTAGLMDSEEAFDSKRSIFTQWAKSQIEQGLYKTVALTHIETDPVTGKTIERVRAEILTTEGKPQHYSPELAQYNIRLVGFQLNNPDFEPKTLQQIADKREATMAIITSKAKAEKAKQEAITAEEEGKAKVMKERYAKMQEKERAVVAAEMVAEVAQIQAAQKVEVAKQALLEAEQKKLKAGEYKAEQILIGEGDAERKRLILEADGALTQKLDAYERVHAYWSEAAGLQKWVPEIVMGGSGSGDAGVGDAMAFMQILGAKAAKDLSLDMSVTAPKK